MFSWSKPQAAEQTGRHLQVGQSLSCAEDSVWFLRLSIQENQTSHLPCPATSDRKAKGLVLSADNGIDN